MKGASETAHLRARAHQRLRLKTNPALNDPYLVAAFLEDELRDRSRDVRHTKSSKSGAAIEVREASARQSPSASMASLEDVVRWSLARRARPLSRFEDGAALGMLHPDELSVAGMAVLPGRARPLEMCLQAAIAVPSRATRTAPTLRTRFGLKEAARTAISILRGPGAAASAGHVDLESPPAVFAEARRPLLALALARAAWRRKPYQLGLTRPTASFSPSRSGGSG